jgi:hypothetical protein
VTETRFIAVSHEQVTALEQVGERLLLTADSRATLILAMVLAWRSAPNVQELTVDEHSVRVDNLPPRTLRVLEGGAA